MSLQIDKPAVGRGTSYSTIAGLAAVFLFFVISGIVSFVNSRTLYQDALHVAKTHDVIVSLNELLIALIDAETGQRGYIISDKETYLAPYNTATKQIDKRIKDLEDRLADRPEQKTRLENVKRLCDSKLAELKQTIELRRENGFEAAQAVVVSDNGKTTMEQLRTEIGGLQSREQVIREQRQAEMYTAFVVAIIGGLVTAGSGLALTSVVASLMQKAAKTRARRQWLQNGQVELNNLMSGDQRVEDMTAKVLTFFANYLGAKVGAFYVRSGVQYYRVATYGVAQENGTPEAFREGENLLGQVAKDQQTIAVNDVPDNVLKMGSAMTHGKPRHLIVAPASNERTNQAVFELGFMEAPEEVTTEFLNTASEAIAVAVRSANYRTQLQNLLEETQRQSEELLTQSEELRVSNEELEEQSRALRESQALLEQQQAEVEQTNAELSGQAQMLEIQRDELQRSKSEVQLKAQELEQASKYKSDFLANMSHELRTPLNSSLILAKLLADNNSGNLTAEQVRYAQTIQSAGNDLLVLINDILDLSKIEAGHMEVRPEPVAPPNIAKDMARLFEPMTSEKGLKFRTELIDPLPNLIETDRQRLEQILKNLLSNAVKFTEKGEVALVIKRAPDDRISFAVRDTGIGISAEQQRVVFDAFRQADGTISRKYGGTGLGLSISRELARLLGGRIELHSEPGKGSEFSLILPERYSPELVAPRLNFVAPVTAAAVEDEPKEKAVEPTPEPKPSWVRIDDDREKLTLGGRVILIIEDDQTFANILCELARGMGFQCLIAHTAEDAMILAMQYTPSAVLLDVGLPDQSGLTVLDRLKRDTRTRHIPVHVVTAGEHAQTAYSLGAAGFLVKPVKTEELQETFLQLETHLSSHTRRVLIVEDDERQREAIGKLLGSSEVETIGVGTAAECLEMLKKSTFDCMVLDLSLPDATGYQLLETLSKEDAFSFPPVIVYTGRDLSSEEEQQLRRYSKSIIVKGAKSPERLLDEVTLFLHQVVSDLPAEQQMMLEKSRGRDAILEGRRILIVEDDVRNVYALSSLFEPHGVVIKIARNGKEALSMLRESTNGKQTGIDLVLMDVMMPEMDGLTATREIRRTPEWAKLPVIMLTAKAMRDDQEKCYEAGANDYMAKPLDVEKLLSLVRVWMPR